MPNTLVSNYALCSLDNVKDFVGINSFDDTDTTVIINLINNVSTQIETYCDRKFKSRSYTDYYDGTGTPYLYLNNYPVISVTSVHDDSSWAWGNDTLIDSDDYMLVDDRYLTYNSNIWVKYRRNIKVIYTAGYSTIPLDLQQVCVEEVVRKWKNRREVDILSRTAEDGSVVRYVDGWMPTTKQILNKYEAIYIA